jgi:HD superfamily phosphohydrolase
MAHPQFEAVNLISDPIHGYIELTKRLGREQAKRAGLRAEDAAEEDLLDTEWLQRLRRISQLQSARWVFPTAEHSRFTHGLGVMHEAGLWGRSLYPTLREVLASSAEMTSTSARRAGRTVRGNVPSEGLVVETLRVAGLLHDVGHGPFAHFFDEHVLSRWPAPPHPSRDPAKRLAHEDIGQAIVERELAPVVGRLRRAPSLDAERAAFRRGEAIDPAWVSFLISKPPLSDPAMPAWVRMLQPLFSGVFSVDNLDYVRRDAYMTGVAAGPIDSDRLRRYAFMSDQGLAIYEPGLGALEMFLTARLFMYNTVYFHRTVRAIDLDLAEAFPPAIAAVFGTRNPLDVLDEYAALDEYGLLHAAAGCARGAHIAESPAERSGMVTPRVAELWRRILQRRPTWRAVHEVRRDSRSGASRASVEAELRAALPRDAGRYRLDLAEADARPQNPLFATGRLIVARRDGTLDAAPLGELLERLPAVVTVGRAYERAS